MTNQQSFIVLDAPKVAVGRLRVTNVPSTRLIELIVDALPLTDDRPLTILAGHVSAINAEADSRFVEAFNSASLSYADGIALVVAGRLWTSDAQRMATTDLAPALMRAMQEQSIAPLRVAVVGSHPGVAADAASRLQNDLHVHVALTAGGYPGNWPTLLKQIRGSHPDILILGLGMPLEALTLQRYANELPACVIITCGGWLRLLSGLEKRAPMMMRKLRLEWLWRLSTSPRRTYKRYVLGTWHMTRIAFGG